MGTPLRVDRGNGFGVNRIGVPGAHSTGWPLAFSFASFDDVSVVSAVSARAVEIADLLVRGAHPHLLVFDVGHHVYDDASAQVPLAALAAEAGVAARALDVTWAAPRGVVGELLVVAKDDLRALLADLPLYDVVVVDTEDPETYEDVVLAAKTAGCGVPPVLAGLPGSRLLYDGHDDHYVYVETRDASLPAALLARLFGRFAGSALLGDRDAVLVHEPPVPLAEALLAESPDWTAWPRSLDGSALTLALAATRWTMGDPYPDVVTHAVRYDAVAHEWGLPVAVPPEG